MNYFQFNKNIHSQNGEDGILSAILNRIHPNNSGFVVEFGAWDGMKFSNTFYLVEKGWSAIYIEGDKEKFNQLLQTQALHTNIRAVNSYITITNSEGLLDTILGKYNCPVEFEILSIDIDSYDLEVWESLQLFRPKIVVIEINSSIPPGVNIKHGQSNCGASFTATIEVGKLKNYSLVCHTGNLIFLDNKFIHLLDLDYNYQQYPEFLFRKNLIWLSSDLVI